MSSSINQPVHLIFIDLVKIKAYKSTKEGQIYQLYICCPNFDIKIEISRYVFNLPMIESNTVLSIGLCLSTLSSFILDQQRYVQSSSAVIVTWNTSSDCSWLASHSGESTNWCWLMKCRWVSSHVTRNLKYFII